MKTIVSVIAVLVIVGGLIVGCSESGGGALTVDGFISAAQKSGLTVGAKKDKMYQMISAVDGCSVVIAGDSVEVYQYDLSVGSGRDALAKIKSNGIAGQPVLVNNNLLIIVANKHPKWSQIAAVFKGL